MAFQSIQEYNEKKYNNWFVLLNDQDSADVIFLYQKPEDALVATVHYLKSLDYSGYVHCTGAGCPACAQGIRTQTKFFIPLYNITAGEVQFWDRTDIFTPQFQKDVFQSYPNPSEFVFRITRHGQYRSRDTRYHIMAVGKNTVASMPDILAKHSLQFPNAYESVCKTCSIPEMQTILNNQPPQQGGFQSAYNGGNSYGGYRGNSYGGNSYGGNSYGGNSYQPNAAANYQVSPRNVAPAPASIPASAPMVAPSSDIPDPIDEDDVEF